jgi:hypothetical protein
MLIEYIQLKRNPQWYLLRNVSLRVGFMPEIYSRDSLVAVMRWAAIASPIFVILVGFVLFKRHL